MPFLLLLFALSQILHIYVRGIVICPLTLFFSYPRGFFVSYFNSRISKYFHFFLCLLVCVYTHLHADIFSYIHTCRSNFSCSCYVLKSACPHSASDKFHISLKRERTWGNWETPGKYLQSMTWSCCGGFSSAKVPVFAEKMWWPLICFCKTKTLARDAELGK